MKIKVINKLDQINEDFILTIGNFDGVHIGHQAMLSEVKTFAVNTSCKMVVTTFSPHPQIVLGNKSNFLICNEQQKVNFLNECGVDYIYIINFNIELGRKNPDDFLREYIDHHNLKGVFLGYDFTFGNKKMGNYDFAKNYFSKKDILVKELSKFEKDGSAVNSTRIRNLLHRGDVNEAKNLLGRPFLIRGIVVEGKKRGRTIGIPTANMKRDKEFLVPKLGVYATKVYSDGHEYNAVTNIGINPTFGDIDEYQIESHLLDANVDLYTKEIEIEFIQFLRAEQKFEGLESLVTQIKLDIERRRELND